MRTVLALAACAFALAACGPAEQPKAKSAEPSPTTPVISGLGVVAAVEGNTGVVLDHEATPGGLPAGRHAFRGYGDVLAEGPLEPGARVAFSYRDWKPQPVLTELKAR